MSLQSGWPRSVASHPAPGKERKKLQNFSDEGHHKPANVIQAKGSHLLLPVAVAPASISWGDYLVPLQLQH